MRPTVESRRKLYLNASDPDAFVLHRGDRLFPLREREPVRIIDADPENDHIELELQSSRLGRGRVDFYGAPPTVEEFEQWLDEVFEVTTPEADFRRYVGNRQSRNTSHSRRQPFARNGGPRSVPDGRRRAERGLCPMPASAFVADAARLGL